MDVSVVNAEYQKYQKAWERCRDSVDGSDVIKSKGERYLPMLPGMKLANDGATLYSIYLDNSLWYPGTGRTFDAYVGTMERKPPIVKMPSGMAEKITPFTPSGQTIDSFAFALAGEIIMGYRPGILIDFPNINTEGMSVAEAERAGARPYATLYPADRITDWGQELRGGQMVTTYVVLEEHVRIDVAKTKYHKESKDGGGFATLRRVLKLDGVYTQELYILTSVNHSEDKYIIVGTNTPVIKNEPFDYIPFIPVTPKGTVWDMAFPLINDVAVLNIADYRNEALYRDALLFNGRPTPCVSGLVKDDPTQKNVATGSHAVLQFETDGKWGTLGGGADAEGLRVSGEDLKQKMALVGSRALSEDPRGVEAAATASLHRQGEDGVLSSVANGASAGMTKALEIMRDWSDLKGEVSYQINTDFIPADMDPARLTALWNMYVSGDISSTVYFYNLERGEIYPNGWTKDDEEAAIAEDVEKRGEAIEPEIVDADPATAGE